MTSAVLILSMLPVALKLGDGGEMRAPLGAVLVGGMATSTFLSLLYVPVAYTYFDSLGTLFGQDVLFQAADAIPPAQRPADRRPPTPGLSTAGGWCLTARCRARRGSAWSAPPAPPAGSGPQPGTHATPEPLVGSGAAKGTIIMENIIVRLVVTLHDSPLTEAISQMLGPLVVALVGTLMRPAFCGASSTRSVTEGVACLDRRFITDPQPADAFHSRVAAKLFAIYHR